MAIQSTLTIQQVNVGSGDNDEPSDQRVNANCAPKSSITLTAGANTVPVPTGFTVNGCYLRTVNPTSTNSKTLKGV
jgi:hypothetical protein